METRIDIINFLSNKFEYKNYLEIGIRNPWECFDHVQCENKDSVDPGFETNDNVAKYKYTSDEFFRVLENNELDKETDFKWDVIFIDGLHTSYQVERDIKNSLNHLSENGTIVLHDCNPPTEYHARGEVPYICSVNVRDKDTKKTSRKYFKIKLGRNEKSPYL